MTFRVAVLDDYQNVALSFADWRSLPAHVDVTVLTRHLPADELADALAPYDALVVMRERTPLPGTLLRQLPRLRLVVTTGQSNASIDLAAAADAGVTVCGTTGMVGAVATVEHTWALILALVRRIPTYDAAVRSGGWQTGTALGTLLHGRTLGIVGLGTIGARVAAVAPTFGMRVTAWSRNLSAETAHAAGAAPLPREEFFATADVVSVHLRLSPRSRHYVGAAELDLMRPTALLVNTSRGSVVDTAALTTALRTGTIGGAALDVHDEEPLPPDDPLRTLPNTVLTPHVGYVTRESYEQYFPQVVDDIAAYLAGSPVRMLAV